MPPGYFTTDGDDFLPTWIARGPWGATVSGNYVGGLLGFAIDRDHGHDELQPTRLTVDLLRPVPMEPVRVATAVVRAGRRLVLVDAELTLESGTVVARASAVLLRRGPQPPGEVWSSPIAMPPPPPESDEPLDETSMLLWTSGRNPGVAGRSFDLDEWQHDGPKFVWLRDVKPLVAGQPMTPFTRAAMAGDVASSLTHYGTAGLHFINADYTLTLSRLPEGEDIGLAALTHSSHDGVATGTAAIFDRSGPIGAAIATALANPGFEPPKER